MVTLTILVALLLVLALAAGSYLVWFVRHPAVAQRHAAVKSEAMMAEARIDFLTRQTMQRMRDVVRDDMRGRQHGEVIEGDVIE